MLFCSVDKCSTPNFSKDKLTNKGYCKIHQNRRTDYDKRTIVQKGIAKQKSLNSKIRGLNKPDIESEYANKLSLWFKYQMQVSKRVCENCGASLHHYTENDWFGSQHHIIEKSLCPSVASHPQNHIVLGFWCCHSQNHTSWINMSKMACYEEMKKRFDLFKDDINPTELHKLHKHPFLN